MNKKIMIWLGFLLLTFISLTMSFFLVFNSSNLKTAVKAVDYSAKTTSLITSEMSYYIDSSVYERVVTHQQVGSDVNNALNYFFNNQKIDKQRLINNNKALFNLEIEDYLRTKEVAINEPSINILSSSLSNTYIANIFIIDEFNAIVSQFHKLSTILLIGLFIALVAIISVLYFTKEQATKRLIFSTSFILLFSTGLFGINQTVYYINEQTTAFINRLIIQYSLYNILFALVYLFVYLLMWFKKGGKVNGKELIRSPKKSIIRNFKKTLLR